MYLYDYVTVLNPLHNAMAYHTGISPPIYDHSLTSKNIGDLWLKLFCLVFGYLISVTSAALGQLFAS